jgi:hypothetical protein
MTLEELEFAREVARRDLRGIDAQIARLNRKKYDLRDLGFPALEEFVDDDILVAQQWAVKIAQFVWYGETDEVAE